MKPFVWQEGMTDEETKNGAYWERNMLAALLVIVYNHWTTCETGEKKDDAGWYKHEGEGFEGWSRVISFNSGAFTFHVPDDFDLGKLPQIEPNWNGHTTEEKWNQIMRVCGIKTE